MGLCVLFGTVLPVSVAPGSSTRQRETPTSDQPPQGFWQEQQVPPQAEQSEQVPPQVEQVQALG